MWETTSNWAQHRTGSDMRNERGLANDWIVVESGQAAFARKWRKADIEPGATTVRLWVSIR